MALLAFEGFDSLNSSSLLTSLGEINIVQQVAFGSPGLSSANYTLVSGLYGGQALRISTNAPTITNHAFAIQRQIPSTNQVIVGFHFLVESFLDIHNERYLLGLMEGTTRHISLTVDASGRFRVSRGLATAAGGGLLAQSTTGLYGVNSWAYAELQILVSDTIGTVSLSLNGTVIATATNVDTRNAGTSGVINLVSFESGISATSFSAARFTRFDNLYILDTTGPAPLNAPLGPVRVDTLVPSADVQTNFTRSSGSSSFVLIDDVPANGDTDFVSSGTSGHKDIMELSNLSAVGGTPLAVRTVLTARKTDAEAINVIPSLIAGGTEISGPSHAIGDSYAPYRHTFLTAPDGSSPWTEETVNDLRLAYRIA
jgi:hypothetical protein